MDGTAGVTYGRPPGLPWPHRAPGLVKLTVSLSLYTWIFYFIWDYLHYLPSLFFQSFSPSV